ncbi:MAG TPA: hypothetical protein VMP03_10825 [Methylomirabilota bacterium]|nr:hypothetical protein [Methylomirabilota bacterium]
MSDLYLTVASWDDRDDLVIELTVGDGASAEDWGLVTFDPTSNRPVLELYPRSGDRDWRFDLDEVQAVLALARDRIVEVAGPIPPENMEIDGLDADTADHLAMPVTTG